MSKKSLARAVLEFIIGVVTGMCLALGTHHLLKLWR
jgi:hypothetical protein